MFSRTPGGTHTQGVRPLSYTVDMEGRGTFNREYTDGGVKLKLRMPHHCFLIRLHEVVHRDITLTATLEPTGPVKWVTVHEIVLKRPVERWTAIWGRYLNIRTELHRNWNDCPKTEVGSTTA
jgi:hypothetical protein